MAKYRYKLGLRAERAGKIHYKSHILIVVKMCNKKNLKKYHQLSALPALIQIMALIKGKRTRANVSRSYELSALYALKTMIFCLFCRCFKGYVIFDLEKMAWISQQNTL